MASPAILLSREAIKKAAGNDGNFKRGLEVQASNKMTEVEFSGEQLIHGKAKCEGSSPGDVYLLKFELDPSMPSARPQADCSCPAAQRGLCKHIVALLLMRAEQIEAEERLRARDRLTAARAQAAGKSVLPEDLPPPPPLESAAPAASAAVEAGSSDVSAVFQPMITNALAAGSALSAAGGEINASSSKAGKRVLPAWLQPKAKPEVGKGKEKKGRLSTEGNQDIRTLLGGKKRPLEVVAKPPPRRKARRTKIVEDESEDEDGGGVSEEGGRGDMAPREPSTRRAAAARRGRLREVAEEEEEGWERGDDVIDEVAPMVGKTGVIGAREERGGAGLGGAEDTGTLGYDWENWGTIVQNMDEDEPEAEERGAGTSAGVQNGQREPDTLWDGEDDDAEPLNPRASSRRGRGKDQPAATRSGRKSKRRTVIEDETEESAPAEEVPVGRNEGAGRRELEEELRADRPPSAHPPPPDSSEAPSASAPAADPEPNVPRKKGNFLYSLKNFKSTLRTLTDDEARQLLSTMAPPEPRAPISDPLSPEPDLGSASLEPGFGDRLLGPSAGAAVSEANDASAAEFEGSPHLDSAPPRESGPKRELAPPPLLSDIVEERPKAAADAVALGEVTVQPKASSGEFNLLDVMLSSRETLGPRARRRALKAAANAATAPAPQVLPPSRGPPSREISASEISAPEPSSRGVPPLKPPVREPVSQEPPSREPSARGPPSRELPVSEERLPQTRVQPAETRRRESETTALEGTGQRDFEGERKPAGGEKPRSPPRVLRLGGLKANTSMEQTGSVSGIGPVKRKVNYGALRGALAPGAVKT